MKLEFLSFVKASQEKYLGLAAIVKDGCRFVFKVSETKNGGYFIAPPAVKLGDQWVDAFLFDSRSENEQIINFVRKHVSEHLKNQNSLPPKAEPTQSFYEKETSDEQVPF